MPAAILAKELSVTDKPKTPQLTPTGVPCLILQGNFCFLFPPCRANPGQGILPSPSVLPSPSQGGQEKSSELLPVPQNKWKEARTRLKSRVACEAEVRYPGLQKETPVWAMLAQGCLGLGTLGPVCVVFEVIPVLKELGICSVFGGKKEGGAKETACHTRSASVTVAGGGEEGQSLSSVFEAKLFPLRKREGNNRLVPWGWSCYSFTSRQSVDSLSQCLCYLLSTDYVSCIHSGAAVTKHKTPE